MLRWYYSDFHQKLQRSFFPDITYRKPLQNVPDDSGPIMAIASLALSEKSPFSETSMPISQISIELYTPSTGLYLGGRFAPESVKVEDMRDYTPKKQAGEA